MRVYSMKKNKHICRSVPLHFLTLLWVTLLICEVKKKSKREKKKEKNPPYFYCLFYRSHQQVSFFTDTHGQHLKSHKSFRFALLPQEG